MSIASRRGSSRPGRILAIGIFGLIAFLALLAALEKIGVNDVVIAYLFILTSLAVYAGIGILCRTVRIPEYFVAGQTVPDIFNGMAAAAGLSGLVLVSFSGTFFAAGYDSLAFALGWAGGLALIALLFASYLRKAGAYTVSDFLAARFGGTPARLAGIIVLIASSFALLVTQVTMAGLIVAWSLGLSLDSGLSIGLAGLCFCLLPGGMRSVTWTQAAQFGLLAVALLVPAIWMSAKITGLPVPQFAYAPALQAGTQVMADSSAASAALSAPFAMLDRFNFFAFIFCLMLGTAALPHILTRTFAASSAHGARLSFAWSLLLLVLLLATVPAYVAFSRFELIETIVGKPVSALAGDAAWIFRWGAIDGQDLVTLCGEQARSLETAIRACGGPGHILSFSDVKLEATIIAMVAPEIAGMPFVVSGLVAAGGLAAVLATANALMLTITNALCHDIYYKTLDRRAPASRRLLIARALVIILAAGAAYLASAWPDMLRTTAGWAFSLAAAGLFPALVLGVWWQRCNAAGALAGIAAGIGVTLAYQIGNAYGFDLIPGTGDEMTIAIPGITDAVLGMNAGIFGVPAGFLIMVVVSLLTAAPAPQVRQLVENIRRPGGETVMQGGDLAGWKPLGSGRRKQPAKVRKPGFPAQRAE